MLTWDALTRIRLHFPNINIEQRNIPAGNEIRSSGNDVLRFRRILLRHSLFHRLAQMCLGKGVELS